MPLWYTKYSKDTAMAEWMGLGLWGGQIPSFLPSPQKGRHSALPLQNWRRAGGLPSFLEGLPQSGSCIQILQSILLFTESTLYKLYPGMKCARACRTLLWLQPNRHSPDHLDHPSQHCDVWTPQQWTQWFRYCSWAGIPEISGWIKNIFILPSGMF